MCLRRPAVRNYAKNRELNYMAEIFNVSVRCPLV